MITRQEIDELAAATGFSGVVRIDRGGEIELEAAYGLADRAHGVRNTIDTQFAVASATKGLTALAIVSLVVDGALELSMRARSWLGDDLPLIDDAVTIQHLLAHRAGISDYVDEDDDLDPLAYLMPVPVHELATTEDYLRVLDGHPAKFEPGARFSYGNSGYVVLALIAERAAGVRFHELVGQRVCEPAGMRNAAFLRSDELPGRAAVGYLDADGPRTNVFHLPVRGSGDGGVYTTVADVSALWQAFFDGRIVPADWVVEMVRPRSATADGRRRYGLGFWLAGEGDAVSLTGADAGVSFRSVHDPARELTHTTISNTTDTWQVSRLLSANA